MHLPYYGMRGHDKLGLIAVGTTEELALGLNKHIAILGQLEAVHATRVLTILQH